MWFTGEHEHSIDAKQRLAIPAEIRAQLDPETHGESFILAPGADGEIWLWPEKTFFQMTGALEQSLLPPDEMAVFEKLLFTQAKRLEIDKAGRIRLPQGAIDTLGLSDSVIILGVKDHLELREPARWKQERTEMLSKQREIMMQARQALAQQRHRTPREGE